MSEMNKLNKDELIKIIMLIGDMDMSTMYKFSKEELIKTILLMSSMRQTRESSDDDVKDVLESIIVKYADSDFYDDVLEMANKRFADMLVGDKDSGKKIRVSLNEENDTKNIEFDDMAIGVDSVEEDADLTDAEIAGYYADRVITDAEWLSVVVDCFFELSGTDAYSFSW